MRKVALLYNPLSGQRQNRRLQDVKAVISVLRNAGVEVIATPTLPSLGERSKPKRRLRRVTTRFLPAGVMARSTMFYRG